MGVHVVRPAGRADGTLSLDPTRITPLFATISIAHLPGALLAHGGFMKSKPNLELHAGPPAD